MVKTNKKKICIVASSLSKGGAERSSAILSQMLSALGYDIHIVTVLSGVDYEYSGTLFNLGDLKKENDSFFGRINRLRQFKKYISTHAFDLIIDNRSRVQGYREFLISKFVYNIPVIYVIHNFNIKKTFTKYTWLNKWLYQNEYMTAVSQAAGLMFKKKFHLKQLRTIYNGFDFNTIQTLGREVLEIELPEKFILFYGRIDDNHKNLKLLLDTYKASSLATDNVKLLILGSGPDLNLIKSYSKQLELSSFVDFKGFVKNPYPYVLKAKFVTLTSRFEGFPMVIPESLCLGIPVVSVDCNSGPNEVIENERNGLLVDNDNPTVLAEAFNRMILDDDLYNSCTSNAVSSVEQFSTENVMQSWDKLIKEVLQ
jgi:glycosyltransferase involved in cell wall biosynthesis|nr:glycosyltransferase [uncultured Psychroserpens sp.]